MKADKKLYQSFFLFLMFGSLAAVNKTHAGMVTLVNQSDVEIKINVVPPSEENPYCWKCLDSALSACGKKTAEIVIPLGGCEYFSIIDTEDGIWGNGKCKNLSVYKNYKVSFSDSTFGTNCVSQEI